MRDLIARGAGSYGGSGQHCGSALCARSDRPRSGLLRGERNTLWERTLCNAYCNAADRHDNEKFRSLYHEDAIDDHGAFFKGLAMEFIDTLPDIQANMEILHHNVTTVNIKLDGNRAEGEVYIIAFHKISTTEGPFDLLIGGRYFDRYEKRNGF